MQPPASYDDCSSWDAYCTQFETLAHFNCWTEEEKATYLAVSLKGPALMVLSNIPIETYTATIPWSLSVRPGLAQYTKLNCIEYASRHSFAKVMKTFLS